MVQVADRVVSPGWGTAGHTRLQPAVAVGRGTDGGAVHWGMVREWFPLVEGGGERWSVRGSSAFLVVLWRLWGLRVTPVLLTRVTGGAFYGVAYSFWALTFGRVGATEGSPWVLGTQFLRIHPMNW